MPLKTTRVLVWNQVVKKELVVALAVNIYLFYFILFCLVLPTLLLGARGGERLWHCLKICALPL